VKYIIKEEKKNKDMAYKPSPCKKNIQDKPTTKFKSNET